MAEKTGEPHDVTEMTKEDFVNWKSLATVYAPNWTLNEEGESVKWTDINLAGTQGLSRPSFLQEKATQTSISRAFQNR